MAIDVGFHTEKPFEELYVSRGDIVLGSIVFGFFLGFLINVTWTAVLETKRAGRLTPYILMIWLEIFGNTVFSVTTWCYLYKVIPPGLAIFTCVIVCWIIQVQCLMLIIVNRLCILMSDEKKRFLLKACVAGLVTLVSLSTACIWIPAQLQINHKYIALNHWWDKFEKCVYLCLDLTLNVMFIVMVKRRLIAHGLTKYRKVMKFNEYIIFVSISMDILLLGVTALPNGYVYVQFHPVTYIVKLAIEMSMSRLLIKVAKSSGINVYNEERGENMFEGASTSNPVPNRTIGTGTQVQPIAVQVHNSVYTHKEDSYEMADRKDAVASDV
ncbi:hypothetical protein VNI00_008530 [Paramarasmius palmivorus]|uniref:Integral membrane protein n=1 Tax=Paramarasmius palmivorus TaxID=297713 RepID=A0AAW0CTG3_9AGAR